MARLKKETEASTEVNTEVSNAELKRQIDILHKKIDATGDTNKIRDYDRRTSQPWNYCYSMGLWETNEGEKVITSWRMTKDYVAKGGDIEEQKMELTLEWSEKITIEYVDFYRMLKRTPKIEATKIFDEDGNAYITRKDELGNRLLVVPTNESFEWTYEGKDFFVSLPNNYLVTLSYKDKEYTLPITFLNV